ncbi:unnamed protein product [Rotaria sp. Silwood1]|nr:unnamed protein product [Rotaria sp. Silwood1]CAF4882078.1 unnamed protein product [Rotaria sp. Silwood1]
MLESSSDLPEKIRVDIYYHIAASAYMFNMYGVAFDHLQKAERLIKEISTRSKGILDPFQPIMAEDIGTSMKYDQAEAIVLANTIWSLPKLIYCYLDVGDFYGSTVTSLSLKRIFIRRFSCQFNAFNNLIKNTPHLRHFSVPHLSFTSKNRDLPPIIPLITRLNIGFSKIQGAIDQLLHTFQSSFWLVKHCWPVQCNWKLDNENISLYTLPYGFHTFNFVYPILSKSTSSINDNDYWWSYDYVHRLMFKNRFYQDSILSNIQFIQLRHLSLSFPVVDQFWSIIPTFNELTSLEVYSYDHHEFCQDQLQTLLDRAPRLYSFTIRENSSLSTQRASLLFNSVSVRELNLRYSHKAYTVKECVALSNSPLGMQCKTLIINVKNRACVLELINRMSNLLSLVVRCSDDKNDIKSSATSDDIIEWFRDRLSQSSTIYRYGGVHNWIGLWIHR